MEIEQLEIRDYLSHCPPFDKLDVDELDQISQDLEITYIRRGRELLSLGNDNQYLYLIRSGAMAVYDADGNLKGQYRDGDWVGYKSVLRGGEITMMVEAVEDSLLYMIPGDIFRSLVERYGFVKQYFSKQKPERLRQAILELRNSGDNILSSTRVGDLIHGQPMVVDESTTIRELAHKMTDAGNTTALVARNGELTGIINDRAFCTKVACRELPLDESVTAIMAVNPHTISAENKGSEALLKMAEFNIRRLPVMDNGRILGVITATDLIRQQTHNTIYLINEIYRSKGIEELKLLSHQLPETLVSLVNHSLTAYDIGHAVSSIGRAIVRRMIYFAMQELGEAPVPFAWIVAGSMARNEQTAYSDQDNALILSNDYDEMAHGQYFEQLSQIVSDGLNACGYVYCPGDVMATNPKWRQPVAVWKQYFNKWIDEPEPMALMYASIFFDLRCVYGDQTLLDEVQKDILTKTQDNSIFLGHLKSNALKFQPPIGLFRNFVLEKTGSEHKGLNLKKRGTVPIIDLARVYALSAGVPALHTQDRLQAAYEAGKLSREGMEDLTDALEFISTVRLKHQAQQVGRGVDIDNYVLPEQLTSLERRHLKDAFDVVRTIQSVMAQRY